MDYYELRKDDKKLKPLTELQEEFKYSFILDKDMLSHRVFYDKNRYYIFSLDLFDVLKTFWSPSRAYINTVQSCNKRNEIGMILTRKDFKLLIVYYTTNSKFRFYIFTGNEVIRVSKNRIRNLSLFSFGCWIKTNSSYKQKNGGIE